MSALNTFLQPLQNAAAAVQVENLVIPGFIEPMMARLYRPAHEAGTLPGVLYFHGGGFVGGSLDDADIPARFIAEHASAVVLSIAYSLAPARPFPAAPEDAYAASMWLLENSKRLKVDAGRLAVAGDDAGGNLAAAMALIARDRNTPDLLAQVLIGPMLDPSMTKLGNAERLRSDITAETCADCYSQYLPRTLERLHPYASPLESRRLRGLPPALIATAECDVLHKEAEQYATALIDAGVPTQVTRTAGNHAELPTNEKLLTEIAEFLCRHLHCKSAGTAPRRQSNASR